MTTNTTKTDRPDAGASQPKQRQSKAETKRTILAHGYEMYRDCRLDRSDVKVAAVLRELGYTTGAAYYIWPNQAAFRRDLMVYVAEHVEYGFVHTLAERIADIRETNESFEQAILRGADAYLDYFVSREDFYISLRFYEDPNQVEDIKRAVSLGYERVHGDVHKFFEGSMATWGKRMVDEEAYSLTDFVVSTTAMVEGFALRHRFQPERVKRRIHVAAGDDYRGDHYLFSVNLFRLAESSMCNI